MRGEPRGPQSTLKIKAHELGAHELAKIKHVKGRNAYGVRRAAVDAAKAFGISREGLMAHGGWSDTQMPDRVYAEASQDIHRKEAATVRAKICGEDVKDVASVEPDTKEAPK